MILNDQAREWFAKMERDEEALSIWEWFKDISMVEYKRIYKMLNMDFDHYTGESFYRDKTAAVVEELKEKNLLKESEGAMIVDLDEYDMSLSGYEEKTEAVFMQLVILLLFSIVRKNITLINVFMLQD